MSRLGFALAIVLEALSNDSRIECERSLRIPPAVVVASIVVSAVVIAAIVITAIVVVTPVIAIIWFGLIVGRRGSSASTLCSSGSDPGVPVSSSGTSNACSGRIDQGKGGAYRAWGAALNDKLPINTLGESVVDARVFPSLTRRVGIQTLELRVESDGILAVLEGKPLALVKGLGGSTEDGASE